jgi:hypothetical protein
MSWGSQLKPNDNNRVSDLDELIRSMSPRLNDGVFVFVSVPPDADTAGLRHIATFLEDEGVSMIVEESLIEGMKFDVLFRSAWITLNVNSDLNAVGLTAAVAKALTDKGISCNVVAAAHHDHLFVPIESAQEAMEALVDLQR